MRSLYTIACCLFLTAITCDLIGKRYYAKAAGTVASMNELGGSERAQAAHESRTAARIGDFFSVAGLAAAGLAGLCWCGSLFRDNRQSRRYRWAISSTLLITYLLILFMAT
jgi:hypothetical protein